MFLTWYTCLSYDGYFKKVKQMQKKSKAGREKPLLKRYTNLKKMTIS